MKKRSVAILLTLCLLAGLCVPAVGAEAGFVPLGTLRVSVNGDVYQSMALLEETSGKVWLPAATVEEFLGKCPKTREIDGALWGDVSAAADSCVYDETLDSLYLWDGLPEVGEAAEVLYPEFGEPSDRPLTYREFFGMLDEAVKLADPGKLAQWQDVLPLARVSQRMMSRFEGAEAILHMAVTLGGEYSEFNTDWSTIHSELGERIWDEVGHVPNHEDLIPDPHPPYTLGGFHEAEYVYDGMWGLEGVATCYTYGRVSLVSGRILFDYDREAHSMHVDQPLTARAAAQALTRLIDSVSTSPHAQRTYALDDPTALHYDEGIITPELLAWAEEMPAVSGDAPPQWNGVVMSRGGDYNQHTLLDRDYFERSAKKLSELGFNSIRYMFTYQTLFDREVTQVDVSRLRHLDQLVAYAMRYRIHLTLVTFSMPGRWVENYEDYTSVGEFDLFTDPVKQEQANAIWRVLATRYKDVPSSVLSFQPLWEVLNFNLSTGLPYDPYGPDDVAPVYAGLVAAIHACDSSRPVLCEATPTNDPEQAVSEAETIWNAVQPLGNVQLLSNFCSMAYVYAEMPGTAGAHLDFWTHSMFKPSYPVTIYCLKNWISQGYPLILNGGLPAGTQIEWYLDNSTSGTLQISSDSGTVYREQLSTKTYNHVKGPLSGYYPYSESDKKIAFTLPADTEAVQFTFSGSTPFNWCGLKLTLPEEYAQERWWYTSAYDQYQEGETDYKPPEKRLTSEILICPRWSADNVDTATIHADALNYTTRTVLDEASRNSIFHWGQIVSSFAPGSATRIESAAFSLGTDYPSALAYYSDFLDMCDEYGIGWFSNDFHANGFFRFAGDWDPLFPGAAYTPCAGGQALKEMLQLYQSHTPVQIPASQRMVNYEGAPEDGRLLLAGYEPNGKMVSLEERVLDGTSGSFLFIPKEGLDYQAILVDGLFRPAGQTRIS